MDSSQLRALVPRWGRKGRLVCSLEQIWERGWEWEGFRPVDPVDPSWLLREIGPLTLQPYPGPVCPTSPSSTPHPASSPSPPSPPSCLHGRVEKGAWFLHDVRKGALLAWSKVHRVPLPIPPLHNCFLSPNSGKGRLRSFAPMPRLCWLAVNWTCAPTWPH